eukprot:CAMPEP_0177765968 /NCGR_PEP_ID=MMETSP0491_2-20121128/8269_1 /TAXON_ID=63592 /ORGANISM="Tetraselmis chuii, Strain PLY429" /LENGTH=73 /DNA_ID=CAMNT_0019282341 /DNA_START=154 /DNA_END=375 /DNA_ORIENTATION=+
MPGGRLAPLKALGLLRLETQKIMMKMARKTAPTVGSTHTAASWICRYDSLRARISDRDSFLALPGGLRAILSR